MLKGIQSVSLPPLPDVPALPQLRTADSFSQQLLTILEDKASSVQVDGTDGKNASVCQFSVVITDNEKASGENDQTGMAPPPYDPTIYAQTVEEATAPVGLTAYGGASYVPARWTRFTVIDQVRAYQEARNSGYYNWVQSIVAGLRAAGHDAELRWDPPESVVFGEVPRQAFIKIPSLNPEAEFAPGLGQYDWWTWAGLDPVQRLIRAAQGTGQAV